MLFIVLPKTIMLGNLKLRAREKGGMELPDNTHKNSEVKDYMIEQS